jgi:hypothetical protein
MKKCSRKKIETRKSLHENMQNTKQRNVIVFSRRFSAIVGAMYIYYSFGKLRSKLHVYVSKNINKELIITL